MITLPERNLGIIQIILTQNCDHRTNDILKWGLESGVANHDNIFQLGKESVWRQKWWRFEVIQSKNMTLKALDINKNLLS
jgi:hypothetical protein